MAYRIYVVSLALALMMTGSTGLAGEGREFAVIDDAAESARVAAAPGTDRSLGRIPAGTRVEILEKRDIKSGMLTVTYYQISFNGKRGWISQYVTAGPQPSPLR